jgi:ABC-type nitrate/sulfonate/bicarbonate transport system permease component
VIRLPASSAQLLGGVRLAAQRAFLGALLAEYVATRNGLGGLVYDSRGRLEFQPILGICASLYFGVTSDRPVGPATCTPMLHRERALIV